MIYPFWFVVFVLAHAPLVTLLAINVSRLRVKEGVLNGDGGLVSLKKAIRAHGNAVEHVVIFGFLVLALELSGAPGLTLAVLVAGFSLSRLAHAYGMLASVFLVRRAAAIATYLFELGASAVIPIALWR